MTQDSGLRTQDSGVIYAMIANGLGNQLFQYAFARALQLKFYPNYKLIINVHHYSKASDQQRKEGLDYNIRHFRINSAGYIDKHKMYCMTFPQFCMAGVRNKILKRILPANLFKALDHKILQPFFNLFGLYNPVSVSAYLLPRPSRSHTVITQSCFENAAYFECIRDTLLEEFIPIHDPLQHNLDMLNDIADSESVCVHIRRGDFLSPENASTFNVCNEEYFVTAMEAIRKEIPNCKFFVFSNDIDSIKRDMSLPFDVEHEKGDNPPYETLRLMYSCKHFIISNSTFSWWAQYLSKNPDKIVYAPTPWHWKGEKWEGLYLPYMRKIECKK